MHTIPPHPFSPRKVFALFLKTGNLTFGGGDPTMVVLHQELVVSNQWITPQQYGLVFGLARLTPGTNLLAFCAGIGWLLLRWLGTVLTVCAVSVPCAVGVIWFTFAYESLRNSAAAMGAIGGTLAAASGMMIGGAYHLTAARWKAGQVLKVLVISGTAFALSFGWGLSPLQVLAAAAILGIFWRVS